MFQMGDIIDLAIQIEKNAESIYRRALSIIANPSLVSILQWLADEEVAHIAWFRQLRETIDPQVKDPAVEAMGKSLLRDVLGKQSFSLKEADFSEIKQLTELLLRAIEFERDKVLFYNENQKISKDQSFQASWHPSFLAKIPLNYFDWLTRQTQKYRCNKAAFSTDGIQDGTYHFLLGLDGL